MSVGGGDVARGGGEPAASGRPDRRVDGAAHVGPEPAPSSARALRGDRRRPVVQRARRGGCVAALGVVPAGILPAGACVESSVSRQVLGGPACAARAGEADVPGLLQEATSFAAWLSPLYAKDWVVYAKPPFGGPEQVLKYLARYTHRVAISNHRLVKLEDGRVTFRYQGLRGFTERETSDAVGGGVFASLRAARVAERIHEDSALRPVEPAGSVRHVASGASIAAAKLALPGSGSTTSSRRNRGVVRNVAAGGVHGASYCRAGGWPLLS